MSKRRRRNPIKMMSVEEISKQYHFHPNSVRRWIHHDGLRNYRKGRGGKIFIREDDLKEFFAKNYEP
jgi:excisionase family DNA binding protein